MNDRDKAVLIKGDKAVLIKGDKAVLIKGDKAVLIKGDKAVLIKGDKAVLIKGDKAVQTRRQGSADKETRQCLVSTAIFSPANPHHALPIGLKGDLP